MASIPAPATQSSRSWRTKLMLDITKALLKKQRLSTSGSQDSGLSSQMSDLAKDGERIEGAEVAVCPVESSHTSCEEGLIKPIPTDAPKNPMEKASEGGVDFTNMTWWQCGMCMVAETISLGILTLPKAVSNLGLVAGTSLLVGMGFMATYTGYVIGQFKLKHPGAHSMDEAGSIVFGKIGGRLCGWGALGFIVFIMGSHLLTFRVMMDVLTGYRFCDVAWTAAGLAISFFCCLPRTLKKMSYMSAASFVSILAAFIVTVVDVVSCHPGARLVEDHLQFEVRAWPKSSLQFHDYFTSICNIAFAYAGHVAFLTFISELQKPQDFNKSLAFLQISDVTMYVFTGVTIYLYAGDNVGAPALNSASPLFSKAAWGVAVLTIIIAGVVNGHIACKYVYVRWFKGREHIMGQKTLKARGTWWIVNGILWTVAWVLAEAIPVFNNIVGLTGAIFASWFTFGIPAMYWLEMNMGDHSAWFNPKAFRVAAVRWNWCRWVLLGWNYFNILVAVVICVVGVYASVRSMAEDAKTSGRPFSCHHPRT